MNGYDLSRSWHKFALENPELIKPAHGALYFFAIELCNKLGWRKKFGLPASLAMDAIGLRSYNTYAKVFADLVNWGFIKLIEKSKNQYTANIIALSKNEGANQSATSKNDEANSLLHQNLTKHGSKQRESTDQSTDSIYKPLKPIKPLKPLLNSLSLKEEARAIFFKKEIFNGFVDLYENYLDLRDSLGKQFKTEIALKASIEQLLDFSNRDYEKAKQIITKCAANEWVSFEKPEEEKKVPQKKEEIHDQDTNYEWS